MTITEVNVDVFRLINDMGKEYSSLNPGMIFIAEYLVYILALTTIIFWFTRNNSNRLMVVCASITFILSEILGKLAGKLHSNYNPFAELPNVNQLIQKAIDNSFPSDHTILFFSFCITFWLFKKGWGFIWVLLAFLVGISRIWVGVHYPADVLAGALISIISAIIVYQVIPKIKLTLVFLDFYERGEKSIFSFFADRSGSKSKDM